MLTAAWCAARLAVGLLAGPAAWAFDASAWLGAFERIVPWLLCGLLLVRPIGERVGELLTRSWSAVAGWSVAMALTLTALWLLPDRLWLLGDFWLRQTNLGIPLAEVRRIVPQAMPLDLAWHHLTANGLQSLPGWDENLAGRGLGLLDALCGCLVARGLARELGYTSAARVAAWSVLVWGGALTLWTGYNKGQAEMALAWWAVAWLGLRLLRTGRGHVVLAVVFALSMGFHRVALLLAPATVFALWSATRAGEERLAARGRWAGFAVAAAGLAALGPALLHAFRTVDGGPLGAATTSTVSSGAATISRHAADFALQALAFVPMLPLALLGLSPGAAASLPPRRSFLLLLTVPIIGLALLFGPGLGPLRDADSFVPPGVALAVLAAWGIARALEGRGDARWAAALVSLASVAAMLPVLQLDASLTRSLDRLEAYVAQPDLAATEERARLLAFVGTRRLEAGETRRAADTFAAAALLAPSPTVLRQWAVAEMMAGDPRAARSIYLRLLERAPQDPLAWNDWGRFCASIGDTAGMRRARARLLALAPDRLR